MKMLYFEIDNGECVPAYTCLPSYRAKITGSKIHSIEACFSMSNITRKGYDWFLNNVEEENESWATKHPHLMRSLKRLALSQSIRHPFKHSNFEPSNHRFPFVFVWIKDKKFTKAYFE